MQEKLEQFKHRMMEITDLGRAEALLGWDQQTYMPRGGAEDRGNVLETVAGLSHRMFTSPEMGEMLAELVPYAENLDPDSDDACLIKRTAHDYEKMTRVPGEWVAEFARITTLAQVGCGSRSTTRTSSPRSV